MDAERFLLSLPFLVLTAVGTFQLVRYRSLRSVEIGKKIVGTTGEVEFGQGLMAGSRIRVLRLQDAEDGGPVVGIDSVVPFLAPNRLTSFSLTKEQARALGTILCEAGRE